MTAPFRGDPRTLRDFADQLERWAGRIEDRVHSMGHHIDGMARGVPVTERLEARLGKGRRKAAKNAEELRHLASVVRQEAESLEARLRTQPPDGSPFGGFPGGRP